ncbi:MAG: 23S rRNA (adenine(2503)-C(2))-methyltransferase RlmN [Ardenticatenia bacterium]|nr:23S rRNA (adenine(2503)-C(2))-methyltransferase RlmN [Ardenticatenia bacterium]
MSHQPMTTTAGQRLVYDLDREEWHALLASWGEPAFRARQIWEWLYHHLETDFEAMHNVPRALRARLAAHFDPNGLRPLAEWRSSDGQTRKWLFELADGERVESVLMEYTARRTACISVQVGCAFACAFCATGRMGLIRNLTAGEIVAQVLHLERHVRARQAPPSPRGITNVVFMGMGEPLSNYHHTLRAVRVLNDADGFRLGARRMTLSTVGLVPAIYRLAHEPVQVNLAVSLHAPTDDLRTRLVPINATYPLRELMEAVRYYLNHTGRRVTFEYAMIADVNDSPELAATLADLLAGLLVHVNLIPLNPVPGSPWQGSGRERVAAFADVLRRRGIPTTVRVRRGIDIAAGCGQLYAEVERRGRRLPFPGHAAVRGPEMGSGAERR